MIIPGLILKKETTSKSNDSTIKEKNNNIELYIFNNSTIEFSKKEQVIWMKYVYCG